MKTEVRGKRQFSKRVCTSYELGDKRLDVSLKKHQNALRMAGDFRHRIQRYKTIAQTYLKNANLPYTHVVTFKTNDIEQLLDTNKLKVNESGYTIANLYSYLTQYKKFETDSFEALYGKVIYQIYCIENQRQNWEGTLIELGETVKLIQIYHQQSDTNKSNSQNSQKKDWAIKLVRILKHRYPDLKSFPQYWNKIPKDRRAQPLNILGYEVYVDDNNKLCADGKEMSKDTFRTEYFPHY